MSRSQIKRYADYWFGDDARAFRECWQDRDWAVVVPAIIANVAAVFLLVALFTSAVAAAIHVLDWLGWMP